MNGWIKVCIRSDILPGEFKVVWDGDTAIAVYNIDGALYAIEDICFHCRHHHQVRWLRSCVASERPLGFRGVFAGVIYVWIRVSVEILLPKPSWGST